MYQTLNFCRNNLRRKVNELKLMNSLFLTVCRKKYVGTLENIKGSLLTSTESSDRVGFFMIKIKLLLAGCVVLIVETELIAEQ